MAKKRKATARKEPTWDGGLRLSIVVLQGLLRGAHDGVDQATRDDRLSQLAAHGLAMAIAARASSLGDHPLQPEQMPKACAEVGAFIDGMLKRLAH